MVNIIWRGPGWYLRTQEGYRYIGSDFYREPVVDGRVWYLWDPPDEWFSIQMSPYDEGVILEYTEDPF